MNRRLVTVLAVATVVGAMHVVAQPKECVHNVPRDDYFTLEEATVKTQKTHPLARPVMPFHTDNVVEQYNIEYAKYGDRIMHLDMFALKRDMLATLPCVIFIHGGGWRSGNKSMDWPMARRSVSEYSGTMERGISHHLRDEIVTASPLSEFSTSPVPGGSQ